MIIRKPAVAGQFYPASKEELLRFFETAEDGFKVKKGIAGIAPHAGYIYSGEVAKKLFTCISSSKIDCFFLIGPNHTSLGKPVSVFPPGLWETPLGSLEVDDRVEQLVDGKIIFLDEEAHLFEHSLEVLTPFIKYFFPEARIIPICVMDQRRDTINYLSDKILELAEPKDFVLASSDFTHFEPSVVAQQKDSALVRAILNYSVDEMYHIIRAMNITACGYGPMAVVVYYSKEKGSKKSKLLDYRDSSWVTGDTSEVVGYASIIFY